MILGWILISLSVAWIGFAYVGYPLILMLLARWSPRKVLAGDAQPSLSVIIAVHNGERGLHQKLESTLALEYPSPVAVIVASDGSTDATEAIAREMADRGVTLVRTDERRGKEAAQANAIQHASGEILVFTDLSAELAPDSLRQIVRPFCDPNVGCVSSEDIVGGFEG